ncbi:hypothetical protein J3R30DRAFT_3474239 [Lentinula aciculospora]|uniref:C2H2-type domain-containing protein n=1 Tax=Lentinula aciculospora TaxID=153920 RepID=A0A9W9DPR6_9AGAR|nr:hypothetical protein J3R30DRAFT_3474239 [Lentinula aciculospora]
MYNGYVQNQSGGPSRQQIRQAASNHDTAPSPGFVLSKTDALTAGQIYLEDQQRKIDEAQARLNIDRMHLAKVARREAIEAQLRAEIAAGEEAKRRLEALSFDRQRSLVLMNSANSYQMPTYEPTPPTSQIVPIDEENRSPVVPNVQRNTWLNTSNVPAVSMPPNASTSNHNSHYQRQVQPSNPQTPGQQSHLTAGTQARPQLPALATQYLQKQAHSQSSAPAQQQQQRQTYQSLQTVQPAQLLQQIQSQRSQQSAQQRSNVQSPLQASSAQSQSYPSQQSQQSVVSHQTRTQQLPPLPQKQGPQSATQQLAPRISTSNQLKATDKVSVSSMSSTPTSQSPSHLTNSAGWQTSGPIPNLANPASDNRYRFPSNQAPKASTHFNQTPRNAATTLPDQFEGLSPLDRQRLDLMHKFAYQWIKQAEVGATENIPLTSLFIHSPAKGQAQIGGMINNTFAPMTPLGWLKALQKIPFHLDQKPTFGFAGAAAAPVPTLQIPPRSTSDILTQTPSVSVPNRIPTPASTPAPSAPKKLKGHAELLVNALNSAHEQPTSRTGKNSNTTDFSRTPADANKKSLARDVLRALGSVSEKRQRESSGENDRPAAKRPALSDIPVSVIQPTLNSNTTPISFPQVKPAVQQPALNQDNIGNRAESVVDSAVASRPSEPSQVTVGLIAAHSKPSNSVTQSIPSANPLLPIEPTAQASTDFYTSPLSQTRPFVTTPPLVQSLPTTSPNSGFLKQPEARSPSKLNVTPLFLPSTPSPPTSPILAKILDEESLGLAESVTVRDSDVEIIDEFREKSEVRKGQTGRKVMSCVQIPRAPAWVKHDLARWGAGQEQEEEAEIRSVIEILDSDEEPESRRAKERESRRSQSSRVAAGEETSFSLPPPVRDPQELAVLEKSITRLYNCSCKWGGCEFILSSLQKLGQHMRNHVEESQQAEDRHGKPILCKICGKHEAQVPDHVENHAYHTLYCPYERCDESFRLSRKLLHHCLRFHRDDELLKETAEPYFADQPVSPPDTPSTLPAYMVVARAVTPHSISLQRHQLLGPWVLKNMMPPVDSVNLKGYLKAKHLGRVEVPTASDEYEFLVSRSSRSCMPSRPAKIRDFGDLNSDQVSQLISDGMSFWQKETETGEKTTFGEPGTPPPSELAVDGSGAPGRSSTDELLLTGVVL